MIRKLAGGTMDQKVVYNFLFHPLSKQHSEPKKIASVLTITALTIITGGLFAVAFGIEHLRTRKLTPQTPHHTFIHSIAPTFKQAAAAPRKHIIFDHTTALVKKTAPTKAQRERAYAASFRPGGKLFNESKEHYVKRVQSEHLNEYFEVWAFDKRWEWFKPNPSGNSPGAHYDWWMFPISRSSSGYGELFALDAEQIKTLKADKEFMKNYRRGVELVLLSWGWDIRHGRPVSEEERTKDQRWEGYGVRLGKMANSLFLLEEMDLYGKVQKFFEHIRHEYPLEGWVVENCSRTTTKMTK